VVVVVMVVVMVEVVVVGTDCEIVGNSHCDTSVVQRT